MLTSTIIFFKMSQLIFKLNTEYLINTRAWTPYIRIPIWSDLVHQYGGQKLSASTSTSITQISEILVDQSLVVNFGKHLNTILKLSKWCWRQ